MFYFDKRPYGLKVRSVYRCVANTAVCSNMGQILAGWTNMASWDMSNQRAYKGGPMYQREDKRTVGRLVADVLTYHSSSANIVDEQLYRGKCLEKMSQQRSSRQTLLQTSNDQAVKLNQLETWICQTPRFDSSPVKFWLPIIDQCVFATLHALHIKSWSRGI